MILEGCPVLALSREALGPVVDRAVALLSCARCETWRMALAGELHPVLQQIADQTVSSRAPRIDELSLEQARAIGPAWAEQLSGSGPDVARAEDVSIRVRHGSIAGRLLVPSGPLKAFIVYFHGGGWVLGDITTYEPVGRVVAVEAGCAVLLVEFRLAPEFPFPAGLEDCQDAVEWAQDNAANLIGRQLPLVLMGDSGGGNLAAVVAQASRGAARKIGAQVLIYPNTDTAPTTASFVEFWDSPLFAGRSMEWFWSRYQPDLAARRLPSISPLRATDLSGLPPTIVVTAEHDPLHDEGKAYAAAMRAADVPVVHHDLETLAHGYFSMTAIFDAPHRTARRIGQDLELLLAGAQPKDRSFATLLD